MSTVQPRAATSDGAIHRLGDDGSAAAAPCSAGESGPADKRIVAGFGFWIFLLSDIVLFSALFATYAVLHDATDGGPGGLTLFHLPDVAIETLCLLLSSFTCGLAMLAARRQRVKLTQVFLALTGLLGTIFLAMELREFTGLLSQGAGPGRSAFLSGFFALVGCHGLHVACGLLWLGTMMAQLRARGFEPNLTRRLMCFSLFWHALDIIWVALFTVVYLIGALP
ncbi:MAG: cytochrome o ubiquinol oxidase subunit III [Gammaproteobacteria bacterium]